MDELPIIQESRFPPHLRRRLPMGGTFYKTTELLRKFNLNTVCEEAKCPNRSECYSQKTATFLALGKACSRSCGFCDIAFSKTPPPPEADEPERIAGAVAELGLRHVVVTMVARDDLPDGGARHIAEIVVKLRELKPAVTVELLTSDFQGDPHALNIVLDARPEIFNHNIETVRRLTPRVRHKATYDRTLEVLRYAKASGKVNFVKSGIMVGLGETTEEVFETISDLHRAGCDILTIGQYLQASKKRLSVKSFVPAELYETYAQHGKKIGISQVFSGPFVRSSYHAAEVYENSSSSAN